MSNTLSYRETLAADQRWKEGGSQYVPRTVLDLTLRGCDVSSWYSRQQIADAVYRERGVWSWMYHCVLGEKKPCDAGSVRMKKPKPKKPSVSKPAIQ
jgi:hypothetical protein